MKKPMITLLLPSCYELLGLTIKIFFQVVEYNNTAHTDTDTRYVYLEQLQVASIVRVHVVLNDTMEAVAPIKLEIYGHQNVAGR